MLMPSIFGENLFDDFFTFDRPQKQYEKEASCDIDENGYPGVRGQLSWISTCRAAKRRISRQN